MKAELKAKFLQYLNQKKQEEGFTFIELLIVIILMGIMVAIALPTFLNQANKGKQVEAKTYIATINKAQQAYYTEYTTFTTNLVNLGVGISTQTVNYKYAITVNYPDTTSAVAVGYTSTTGAGAAIKNYAGYVSLIPAGGASGDYTGVAILCEQNTGGAVAQTDGSGTACGTNQIQVGSTQ
jgi:prepilin-type N-terminal cleavage/methylation domain-containing protein